MRRRWCGSLVLAFGTGIAVCQGGAQDAVAAKNPRPVRAITTTAEWQRIQRFPWGALLDVTSADGTSVECTFAGATEEALICDDPNHLSDKAFQFERTDVARVKRVKPHDPHASRIRHAHWGRWITVAVVSAWAGKNTADTAGAASGAGLGAAVALLIEGAAEGLPRKPAP